MTKCPWWPDDGQDKNPSDQGTYEADCFAERIEMTPDLKELERLARAATPGPWTYDGDTWELSAPSRKGKVEIATIETGWTEPMESEQQANIAYILAANPAAILSLIAELTRPETTLVSIMRAELEQAKKDAERYRWLTADHADAEMRDLAEDTGIRLRWIGKGSADAAIDAAIAKESA